MTKVDEALRLSILEARARGVPAGDPLMDEAAAPLVAAFATEPGRRRRGGWRGREGCPACLLVLFIAAAITTVAFVSLIVVILGAVSA